MGLEPTTFELEVQRASIAPQGWVLHGKLYDTKATCLLSHLSSQSSCSTSCNVNKTPNNVHSSCTPH